MIKNETKEVFFETLVWNQREEVLSWLRFKYSNLSYADAQDIYQEASVELWKKFLGMTDWHGEDMTGMLKVFCRNIHSHWLHKQVCREQWDDRYYPQDVGVESDYGFITSETAHKLLKERMYERIESLEPRDRSLMELYLQKVRMDKIAQQLGFRTAQVARNRKSKIVVKLSKEINAQAQKACASFVIMRQKCVILYSQNASHRAPAALTRTFCSVRAKVCTRAFAKKLPFQSEWYIYMQTPT